LTTVTIVMSIYNFVNSSLYIVFRCHPISDGFYTLSYLSPFRQPLFL